MLKFLVTIFLSLYSTAILAAEVRDTVLPPPKMVQRSIRVNLKECLASLGTASTSRSYGCFISVSPPTPGDQLTYRPAPHAEHPAATYSTGVLTTPTGARFGAKVIIFLTESAFALSMESFSTDAATGLPHMIKREDAVNEITRLWNLNRVGERDWNVMVWVFGR